MTAPRLLSVFSRVSAFGNLAPPTFTIRKKDADVLTIVLPEFIRLYQKDDEGHLKDEYEPLRMAIQLYEQAYAIHYWKARHILWWSAIEALYGNNEDAAMVRIYALFGNKNLVDGYKCPIYETGDVPSYFPSPASYPTLGEMVPLMYDVRNASAPRTPLGGATALDVLAEAAIFIIRKTVLEILHRGLRDRFRDRDTREKFWLYQFGLDKKKQSKKRLKAMYDALGSRDGVA